MFPSNILIAGCGYLGTYLGREFVSRGSQVYGLRRSLGGLRVDRLPEGMILVRADLTRPETMRPLPEVDLVVVCQAPGKSDIYEKTYLEGTRNLLAALSVGATGRSPLPQILFISSTSVYSTRDGAWVDEQTDPRQPGHAEDGAGDRARILLDAEQAVFESQFSSKIVRLSGIYGPGRNRLTAISEGIFAPELSDEVTNRVRVEDIVSAVCAIIEHGKSGERFLVSDDQPTPQREFYEWLYAKLGLPLPVGGGDSMKRHGGNKRVRNTKVKALGWTPRYPSYREGYDNLIAFSA